MEEWKIIPDFPNYSVSNTGNVKNNITGKLLKISKDGSVTLYTDEGHACKSVLGMKLKAFESFPSDVKYSARTKIRVVETGKIYYGYKDVCNELGIPNKAQVCRCLYGLRKSTHGYHFELM